MKEVLPSKTESLAALVREAIDKINGWEYDDLRTWRDRAAAALSVETPAERKFTGVGELERTGYIPAGSAAEREASGPTPHGVVYDKPGWLCSVCGFWNNIRDNHCAGIHLQGDGSSPKTSREHCTCAKPEPALIDHGMASLCEKCGKDVA